MIADFSLYSQGTIIFQGLVAFELWLACYTQEEIAEECDIEERSAGRIISDISANLPKGQEVAADHLVDFTPPIYNVWKFKERTTGNSHFRHLLSQNYP